MQAANRLKRVLAEGKEPAMGVWQMLPGSNISRILARSGADWVMVDCEHGNIDGRNPTAVVSVPRQAVQDTHAPQRKNLGANEPC